jgi:ParB-like chromosome segregation protein Spo0J
MKVIQVPIENVIPYERNPRNNIDAVDKVAASIREFGWRQPIVVDEGMVVIAGHTRLMAAKQLGLKDVPVHVAIGLTPEQVKAYRIADNRVGEEAEWKNDLLKLELEDLAASGFGIDLTGFDASELNEIMFPEAPEIAGVDEPKGRDHVCPQCGHSFQD